MLRRGRAMLKRRSDGSFELRLPAEEREFLAGLADQMDMLLDDRPDDPTLRRLSPPAYLDDVAREAEFQVFKAGELRDSRRAALDVLRATARRTELTEAEVVQWMQALNSIRLVLGARLDVSEDEPATITEDDPALPAWALYDLLSMLLDRAVQALAGRS